MQEYPEFHYPASGETSYEIRFSWGRCDIHTTAPVACEAGDEDERYGGYIVARPRVRHANPGTTYWTYLVTPGGKVWRRLDDSDIFTRGHRHKVRKAGEDNAAMTGTALVESSAGPVINDFLRHPDEWSLYGMLVPDGKEDFRLKRVAATRK